MHHHDLDLETVGRLEIIFVVIKICHKCCWFEIWIFSFSVFWFYLHIKRCTASLHSQCRSMSWTKRLKRSSRKRTADWGRTYEPWRTETSVCVSMYCWCHCCWCIYDISKSYLISLERITNELHLNIQRLKNFVLNTVDLASEEKKRLEEKQRAARKNRSKSDDECKTRCRIIS